MIPTRWVLLVLLPLLIFSTLPAQASWSSFEGEITRLEEEERKVGVSYLLSGSLVVVGGITGYQSTNDTAVKMVFGVLQGLGIGAIGVGLNKITGDHEYHSFYRALKTSSLSNEQRNELVRTYLEQEKRKKAAETKIAVATHIVAGLLNAYTASREPDAGTQSAFYLLAGVHAALAISYSF